MDLSLERDSSVLGSLFQHIINDMKNTSPLWEDFVAKAAKLHACLRSAIQAIAAYLDAFQKIADAATNSRGASKEIGTALTRVCLRHKAVETRLKTFTAAIMDCLVQPLQEKLEDWKRTVAAIDKEHAKEYKRCRTELKKRSSDTLRLQKKARKGQSDTIQSLMDSHMQDVTLRRAELEEVEKKALRSAMIEERLRYCTFVHMLQPVVKEECEVMSELGHLQEAMQSIANVTKDPNVLPAASEELIQDTKVSMSLYPESPGGGSGSQGACSNSLGSRKSSVCSISSMNSSGSSNSPGHHHYPRSLSQLISPAIRLKPGESSDSGFCSSPALTTQTSNVTNQSNAASTWPPHSQDAVPLSTNAERPHTISTTYEKGHQRPPLTVYTFQNPETIHEGNGTANGNSSTGGNASGQNTPSTQKSPANTLSRPPLPVRCSSLERPLSSNNANSNNRNGANLRHCPSPIPAHITKELSTHHAQQQQQQQQMSQQPQPQQQLPSSPPTYVNMSELANMAALKITNQQQQQQQQQPQTPLLQQQHSIDSISSQHSNESGGSSHHQQQQQQQHYSNSIPNTPHPPMKSARSHSTSSSSVSSHTPSLHSNPSLESTVATPLVASQTPTTSSGSSTPQNHYSPLLTNSPSSTAAGTPSGASITSGGMTGNFIYNVCSPTPPVSAASSIASTAEAALKITETDSNQTQVQQNISSNQAQMNSTVSNASASITNSISDSNTLQDQNFKNSAVDTDSPTIIENDERSRASVLQKASMFEKQAAAVAASAVGSSSGQSSGVAGARTSGDSGIYGTRRLDDQQHYRTGQQAQQEPGDQLDVDKSFEDSIQELNNLIGELDSFQREIDESKQQHQQHQRCNNNNNRIYGNIDPPFPVSGFDNAIDVTNITTTTTTSQGQTTIISSSNQTNSSGCGTDISDTTSDELGADTRSVTSLNFHSDSHHSHHNNLRSNLKQQANYNSDSELSRCYVSETSSLIGSGIGCTGGDGYENPTFAHFSAAAAAATACAGDSISQAGSELCQQERQAYIINADDGDSSSAVVVIYDHQIPMTPDIDYVKQNSEIVVLRTKDPQQQQQTQQQEMRELQQLPTNLSGTPPDSPTSPSSSSTPHTATIAPAKQRLSSFRASSEQQIQLLGLADNGGRHQHGKGTIEGVKSSFKPAKADTVAVTTTAKVLNEKTSSERKPPALLPPIVPNDTIKRRKLPPKPPSLSIFNGGTNFTTLEANNNQNSNLNNSSHSINGNKMPLLPDKPLQQEKQQLQLNQQQKTPTLTPLTFKADLDAKLRKQKQKLLQKEQEQQQQTQTQTQTQQTHTSNSNNCNANNYQNNNNSSSNSSSCKLSQTNAHSNNQYQYFVHQNGIQEQHYHHHQLNEQFHDLSQEILISSSIVHKQNNHNNIVHQHQNNNNHQHKQQQQQCAPHECQNHLQNQQSLNIKNPSTLSLPSVSQTNSSIAIINSSSMLHSKHLMPAPVSPLISNTSSVIETSQSPNPNVVPIVDSTTASTISSCFSSNHLLCSSNAAAAPTNMVAHTASATSKPCITPRPASLSGGGNGTRIPRRSSINTSKPPPPVRRSSSVTPSHNSSTGSNNQNEQQQPQQQSTPNHTTISNLSQQHKHGIHNSTESLPPPPAYLLDARQAQCQTPPLSTQTALQNGENSTTATSTSTLIPNSALKVAETVKALSAMRHQPASPNALRRLQQTQQQQHNPQHQNSHQSPPTPPTNFFSTTTITATASSSLLLPQDEDKVDYTGFYNPYIEVNSYALSTPTAYPATMLNSNIDQTFSQTLSSPPIHQTRRKFEEMQFCNKINHMISSSPTPSQHEYDQNGVQLASGQTHPNNNYSQQNHFQSHTPQLLNHHHLQQQQQQLYHQQQLQQQFQQQQQQYYHQQSHYLALQQQQQQQQLPNTDAIYGNSASFRTTSPGIYAQPKVVTNMSSFRSASPGSNGHHGHQTQTPHATSHSLPPTQPKTNPNLIAQLNARLNSKQQQNSVNEGIYGSSTNSPPHQRSLSAHADHNQHHQQQQQQQQQQLQQQQLNEAIYARNYGQQQTSTPQHHQQLMQHTFDDYVGTNIEKAGSIRSKTKAEFLENLNAKLAKQNISGRAFAVRSLINSKALPDPRVCHESLMDQIKRGATLKRNQKINDRSAPKIL